MAQGWLRRSGALMAAPGLLGVLVTQTPTAAAPAAGRAVCEPGVVVSETPWAQRMLAAERLRPFSTGRNVTVAVIDSAVDESHPQLRGRIQPGLDLLDAGSGSDCVSHGTEVASIIAARPASGTGFRGLAPDARIFPVRVSDRSGTDDTGPTVDPERFAGAIRTAATKASVINISLVMDRDDPAVRAAVVDVIAANVVVVAAAGNGHRGDDRAADRPSYPAAYPGVIGVGAIAEDGSRMPQSQVGEYVDIVAPGVKVLAATPVRGHAYRDGTSYAAPFVAATAALVRAARTDLTAAQVTNRIIATAAPSRGGAGHPGYGEGVIDPYRALTEVLLNDDPAALPTAPARRIDAVARSREAAWDRMGTIAMAVTGVASGGLVLFLIGVAAWRRGQRRHWRPGRAPSPNEPGRLDEPEPLEVIGTARRR